LGKRRTNRRVAEIAEGSQRIFDNSRPEAERWIYPASHGVAAASMQRPSRPLLHQSKIPDQALGSIRDYERMEARGVEPLFQKQCFLLSGEILWILFRSRKNKLGR
jgi:hypothetical protein